MTLPSTDSISTYGGIFIDASPVENPQTDLSATNFTQMSASVAMGTHTAIRAWVQFTGNATTPILVSHDALWGNAAGVTPTLVRTALGQYFVSWPTSVNDELGVAHSVNVRAGWGNGPGNLVNVNVTKNTSTSVYVWCSSGASASDLVGSNIDVFII